MDTSKKTIEYCDGGTVKHYKGDKLHNDDGPALIYPNGYIHYYKDGKLHNENGPATITNDGNKFFYINGKFMYEHIIYERGMYNR